MSDLTARKEFGQFLTELSTFLYNYADVLVLCPSSELEAADPESVPDTFPDGMLCMSDWKESVPDTLAQVKEAIKEFGLVVEIADSQDDQTYWSIREKE